MRLESYRIRFLRFNKDLIFGYVRRGNAFIAEPEKALLDSLNYGEYAYISEALESGISDGTINVDKLVTYAGMFSNKSLMNRLGFFLEHYCGIERKELLKHASAMPVHLSKKTNKYDKKWRVYYGG